VLSTITELAGGYDVTFDMAWVEELAKQYHLTILGL
jgi:hypothetical protein